MPKVLRQGHAPVAQPCSPIFHRCVCHLPPWLSLSLDALLRPAMLLPLRHAHARPQIDTRSLLRIPPRYPVGVLLSEVATVCFCALRALRALRACEPTLCVRRRVERGREFILRSQDRIGTGRGDV